MRFFWNYHQALNDENPVEAAVRNSIILNRMFIFLPTNFLLNIASLVNKLWCEESRKFIRDYRKCTARISHVAHTQPFPSNLIKFNEYLSETNTAVPYNGISFAINFTKDVKGKHIWRCFNPSISPGSCHSQHEYDKLCGTIRSSSSDVKLKYLSIDMEPVDCLHCSKHYFSMGKVLRFM